MSGSGVDWPAPPRGSTVRRRATVRRSPSSATNTRAPERPRCWRTSRPGARVGHVVPPCAPRLLPGGLRLLHRPSLTELTLSLSVLHRKVLHERVEPEYLRHRNVGARIVPDA